MLRSQIKRAPDGFIELRFKDFEKSSGRRTILRHFAHAVTNQRGTGRQFFQKCPECTFSSERHRTAPGRTSVSIGQQPDGARTDIENWFCRDMCRLILFYVLLKLNPWSKAEPFPTMFSKGFFFRIDNSETNTKEKKKKHYLRSQ